MKVSKYGKARFVNTCMSLLFTGSGLYLAYHYYSEFPSPGLHPEGLIPLGICLLYFIFGK